MCSFYKYGFFCKAFIICVFTTMNINKTPLLSYRDIKKLWLERINERVWYSNRYARYLMDIGIEPPLTGNVVLNPWADFNISGINKLIDAGVAAVDQASSVYKVVADVKNWHTQYPQNWQETRNRLRAGYLKENGGIRDKNGFELNKGSIIAAMLYGAGDFQETLKCAFNFGWDADCNAATVGTILGTVYGYRQMMSQGWQIVDRYQNTTHDNMPMDETITSFADRLTELFELINSVCLDMSKELNEMYPKEWSQA